VFAIDAERHATGPEYAKLWTAAQERSRKLGTRVPDVFAVVEDEQDSTPADGLDETVDWRPPRPLIKSECRGYLLQDKVFFAHRREVYKKDAIRPLLRFAACELHGQAGLANASEADELDESGGAEEIADSREVSDAADEACQGLRGCRGGLESIGNLPLARSPGWSASFAQPAAELIIETKRFRQAIDCRRVWTAACAALQVRDGACAQSGAPGEISLGQACLHAMKPQEVGKRPGGCVVVRRAGWHRRSVRRGDYHARDDRYAARV
jgi:hypothetical protein